MRLLAICLILCALPVCADSITYGGFSTHIGSEHNYEWFHRMVLLEKDSYVVGYFRNSYDEDTFTVGKMFTKKDKQVNLNLYLGATYGYRESSGCYKHQLDKPNNDKIVCPAVAIGIDFPEVKTHPSILLLGNALVFGFKY